MYDPTLGRFLSEDPIGFESGDVNIYRYVGNAPTMFTDPSGLVNPVKPIYDIMSKKAAAAGAKLATKTGLKKVIDVHSTDNGRIDEGRIRIENETAIIGMGFNLGALAREKLDAKATMTAEGYTKISFSEEAYVRYLIQAGKGKGGKGLVTTNVKVFQTIEAIDPCGASVTYVKIIFSKNYSYDDATYTPGVTLIAPTPGDPRHFAPLPMENLP